LYCFICDVSEFYKKRYVLIVVLGRFLNQSIKKIRKKYSKKTEENNEERNETESLIKKEETIEEEVEEADIETKEKYFSPKLGIVKEETEINEDELQTEEFPSNSTILVNESKEHHLSPEHIEENILDNSVPSNAYLLKNSLNNEDTIEEKKEVVKIQIYHFFKKLYNLTGFLNIKKKRYFSL
jgi:hypothetical protein